MIYSYLELITSIKINQKVCRRLLKIFQANAIFAKNH